MIEAEQFLVIELDRLTWPDGLQLPKRRHRLFIAADANAISNEAIHAFAESALEHGMVLCCCWGPDCERVHDCVDSPIVKDETGANKFRGPNPNDVIMTTWHKHESLKEALWFFSTVVNPSDGLLLESDFWLAIIVKESDWTRTARNYLRKCKHIPD